MPTSPFLNSTIAALFYLALVYGAAQSWAVELHALWVLLVSVPMVCWYAGDSRRRSGPASGYAMDAAGTRQGQQLNAGDSSALHDAASQHEKALKADLQRLRDIGNELAAQYAQLGIDRASDDGRTAPGQYRYPGERGFDAGPSPED